MYPGALDSSLAVAVLSASPCTLALLGEKTSHFKPIDALSHSPTKGASFHEELLKRRKANTYKASGVTGVGFRMPQVGIDL